MNTFNQGKKFIDARFFLYLGGFYCATILFMNEKLNSEMKEIIKQGKKKQAMHEIHDRIAGSYEKITEKFEFRNQIHKYRRILISYAKGKVLECGVGTGKSLEFYKDDSNVIAIDYSNKMLEVAADKLNDRDLHNITNKSIELKLMDCEELEFKDNSFDTVVDINNFQAYSQPEAVMKGVKRVLKDNGTFVFLARGESDWTLIRLFYQMFRPYVFMKSAQDLTINWENLIDNDKDWEILYKERKNYGRTYIYVLKLHKNNLS
jgi:ubiquinone/menaquinone biosynthesis C-methylase UbiE